MNLKDNGFVVTNFHVLQALPLIVFHSMVFSVRNYNHGKISPVNCITLSCIEISLCLVKSASVDQSLIIIEHLSGEKIHMKKIGPFGFSFLLYAKTNFSSKVTI